MNKEVWGLFEGLRSIMPVEDSFSYVYGLAVYKKLSDDFEKAVKANLPSGLSYEHVWENEEDKEKYFVPIAEQLGYEIESQFLFSKFEQEVSRGDIWFDSVSVAKGLKALEQSSSKYNSQAAFANLFEDVDLSSVRLGRTNDERTKVVSKIIGTLSTQKMTETFFEELLDVYVSSLGKYGGSDSSPNAVSTLVAKVVGNSVKGAVSVYDPTCGMASSLLKIGEYATVKKYVGQEINKTIFNIARMNMLVHGVNYKDFDIQLGDTLTEPKHFEQFDVITSVPPFAMRWNTDTIAEDDPRFAEYGTLAPKSKADYAFIQHMLYHLDEQGIMGVIEPLGVLFRGAAEGKIRKHIIEQQNALDAVISLPEGLFYNTGIPVCLLIFKKDRQHKDSILFIEASNDYVKGRPNNTLSHQHIQKIVDTYQNYENVDKYARVVPVSEIEANDYNLNVSRYIDLFEEEVIDVVGIEKKLDELKAEMAKIDSELEQLLKKLG